MQTYTYIPTLTNAQAGDKITLTINNTSISFDLINLNPIDIVRRLITEATAGRSDIKKALSDYNFGQSGNMLIVSVKNPSPISIKTNADYSLECNINNKIVPASFNISFP